MPYHAKHTSEFVGLRFGYNGARQIVYDAQSGQRVVLNIASSSASEADIDEALQEGIGCRNVLRGVLAALNSRSIDVDFASSGRQQLL